MSDVVLRVIEGPDAGWAREVSGRVVVGRDPSADLRLNDTQVSRRHFEVSVDDGSATVEDLGSTNGTFLDQRKVTAPAELRAGDRLRIGKTTLELKS